MEIFIISTPNITRYTSFGYGSPIIFLFREYTEIKEQMYQDKLAHLKKQLYQLEEASHPEYLRRLKKVEQVF